MNLLSEEKINHMIEQMAAEPNYQHDGEDWTVGLYMVQSGLEKCRCDHVDIETMKRLASTLTDNELRDLAAYCAEKAEGRTEYGSAGKALMNSGGAKSIGGAMVLRMIQMAESQR